MPPNASNDLTQVLYVSQARAADIHSIRALMRRSIENNTKLGLTGLLLYTGDHFAQLIEGPGPALSDVMWRIAQDDRHTRMRKLATKQVSVRSCREWAMKLLVAPEVDHQVRELVNEPLRRMAPAVQLLTLIRDLSLKPQPA